MKRILTIVAWLPVCACGQLVVTEINSNGTPADFWELTNFGAEEVPLGGYRWTDAGGLQFVSVPAGVTIKPQESVVFVTGADVATFRAGWRLAAGVQVIAAVDPGLGQNDAIRLFVSATAPTPLLTVSYAAGGFVRSNGLTALGGHAGLSAGGISGAQSMILDPNFGVGTPRYTFATGGNFGTWQAPGGTAVGSPGVVGTPASNSAPYFIGENRAFWSVNKNLVYSPFRVQALDSDVGQTVSLSVVSKPDWLSLVADGPGRYRFGGTPLLADGGDHEFTVRAADNAPGGGMASERSYVLTVFPPTAPVLLNEYNAVGSNDQLDPLNGGTDTFFGTRVGNGGDWFELVVTGDGKAGSVVDMRGWKIDVMSGGETKTIVLSQDSYWSKVLTGTLLTFIEDNTAGGGLDTEIHRVSTRNSTGHVWSNVWIHDPIYIDQAASTFGSGVGIDNNNTWFTVRNASGAVVYGPAGEGIASSDADANGYPEALVSVSSQEVLALRSDPLPGVDPLFGNYNDQELSSFGGRNVWSSGTKVQSFAAYVGANTPPRITSVPVRHAVGSYSLVVTAVDSNGTVPVVSCPGLPSFLTFSGGSGGGTIVNNRPLTLADAGEHVIRIEASDGTYVTPQAFVLTVFNSQPAVLVNEFNAVDGGFFLNGGTLAADGDGGEAASDAHFGRVDGNGGDWLELVVTGDGGPGVLDMRGWRIQVGQDEGPDFRPSATLVLSQHTDWSAVPTGTLLTFVERNTAQGGLDTGIRLRDRRATVGDTWSNIWLGDSVYLTYTDAAVNGYVVADGVASGLVVDHQNTRVRVLDGAGRVVNGPVGESVMPVSGVENTQVFKLRHAPSPPVTPLSSGYVADGSSSSFGWPNEWSGAVQSFAAYVRVLTPYEQWIGGYGVADSRPEADPDGDGRSNRVEYAFGGNPGAFDRMPAGGEVVRGEGTLRWDYVRRAGDPSLVFRHERSADLVGWEPVVGEVVTVTAHPTMAGMEVATVVVPAGGVAGYFRVALLPTAN